MKIALIYLTGTGTTAFMAQTMGETLRSKGHEVTLFRIEKVEPATLTGFDLIGYGTPTFSYRSPRLMTRLLTQIVPRNVPFFLFCTCGGSPGNTIWSMYKTVIPKGGSYLGGQECLGCNNIRGWRPKLTRPAIEGDGLSEEELLKASNFAGIVLENYESIIVKKTQPAKKQSRNLVLSLYSVFFSHDWEMRIAIVGTKHVDTGLCTKCGLCSTRICPSGAISVNKEKIPQFNEKICIGCNSCVNLCPQLAIWSKMSRGKQPYLMYKKTVLNPPK